MSGAENTSATPCETSSFHSALEDRLPSGHDVSFGDHSGARSCFEPKSEYFSTRAEEMMQSRSQFSSDVEHEIAHSKVHWSEVPGISDSSEDNDLEEDVISENRKVFAELMNDPQWRHPKQGHFFRDLPSTWRLGRKVGEGGQAKIFEVFESDGGVNPVLVLKVFKRGSRLSDLRKQWPCGILQRQVSTCPARMGMLLDDGRFMFVMLRCWGDLRKLIDQAMREKNNRGPPFPYEFNGETLLAIHMIREIARSMADLHKENIVHGDLKAANILLYPDYQALLPIVADFECSIGIKGTGFWRPPEILLALKNRCALVFSEKGDVYSFGMICFEIVTGRLPFEGELENTSASRDLVIAGRRPKLPSDLDVSVKDLIESCWNPIPNERPSFLEIESAAKALSIDIGLL